MTNDGGSTLLSTLSTLASTFNTRNLPDAPPTGGPRSPTRQEALVRCSPSALNLSFGLNWFFRAADDCNGHGTHVAGTVGGFQVGVARNSSLVSVKVLGCEGTGLVSQMISGLQWIVTDYTKRGKGKAVISASACALLSVPSIRQRLFA